MIHTCCVLPHCTAERVPLQYSVSDELRKRPLRGEGCVRNYGEELDIGNTFSPTYLMLCVWHMSHGDMASMRRGMRRDLQGSGRWSAT